MKIILVFLLFLNLSLLCANSNKKQSEREKRIQKQIEKEIQTEKRYAKEQTFYTQENYDFKGAEVNKESLKSIQELEPQYDFDMDSVYE